MKLGFTWSTLAVIFLGLLLGITLHAQQSKVPITQNSGQASQPPASSNAAGSAGATGLGAAQPQAEPATSSATGPRTENLSSPSSATKDISSEDNPYDPLLEVPPLPKSKTTLIGGLATGVDHVRNRLTVQPFGGGKKLKVFLDERSHIYRNGTETTILGVHKGDRVYVDTMLAENDHILARNVRVLTENGLAEVRGQVLSASPGHGTINVRDQLSSKPVTFTVSGATKYSSTKGEASSADVQPGALIDVQFSPRRDKAVAEEITVLAKPGDNYIFSGVVTSLDMRTNTFYLDNRSDDQSYQVHFTRAAVSDMRALKVGAEVTARAVFDGKQYSASNVRVEKPGNNEEGQRSEVQ